MKEGKRREKYPKQPQHPNNLAPSPRPPLIHFATPNLCTHKSESHPLAINIYKQLHHHK